MATTEKTCLNCRLRGSDNCPSTCLYGPSEEYPNWQPEDADIPASDLMVTRQDNGGPTLDDGPVKSDGGSSAYYKLPPEATDLMDLIEAEEMSFARGNMFKALFRLGKKAGTDVEYDLNKLQWFLDRMRDMHRKDQRL